MMGLLDAGAEVSDDFVDRLLVDASSPVDKCNAVDNRGYTQLNYRQWNEQTASTTMQPVRKVVFSSQVVGT